MPSKSTPFQLDRVAFVLIGLITFSAAWSVAAADWMPRLDFLGLTVIAALFSSGLISTRAWRPRYAHLLSIAYGSVWVTFIALTYMPDKVYGYTWLDTIRTLLTRLGEHIYIWGEAVRSGGVASDNTIFLLFFAMLFWIVTYIGVWNTVRRQHLWLAVAPSGIALLVNMYYYGKPEELLPFLIIYLLAVLLYAARLYTLNQEQRWNFSRVHFNPEIKRDFLQIGLAIALAAVVFAVIAPTVFGAPQVSSLWSEISRPIRSVEETFNRLFAGLQPHGLPFTNPFGRTLALTGQRNLGDELVMEVRSPEAHYWQAVVYDHYSGTAFQSSDTQRVSVNAREPIRRESASARTPITQTFYTYFPNNTQIFAASQPLSIDKPSWAESFSGGEIALWTTLTPLTDGESYQVVSAISQATVEQLRAAGVQYPPGIRARYLQLPDSLPDRVRELARRIVADAKAINPYDQVSALELWLRANIKYNDQINAPAPGQDGVDYVLFVTRQGYCDYYASALAVMARSLGIPARVVTGYAEGEIDSKRGLYQVRQFNAHTWVEAYFPDYGWIQFEPTATQLAIERPRPRTQDSAQKDSRAESPSGDPSQVGGREIGDELDSLYRRDPANLPAATQAVIQPLVGVVIAIGLGMILLVAGGFVAMNWYENRGSSSHAGGGTWAFARLARMTRWLRLKLSAADTPYEQAKTIGLAVPQRREEIDQLADLYVRERYGRAEVDLNQPRSIWKRIHWSLWRAGLKRRLLRRWSAPYARFRRLRR